MGHEPTPGIGDTTPLDAAHVSERNGFRQACEARLDAVYDFALRLLGDPASAARTTRETFASAAGDSAAMPADTPFHAWLFAFARDEVVHEADARGPAAAHTADNAQLVDQASRAFDIPHRAVLELHLRHGFDASDIAVVLGVSEQNAEVALTRLRDTFDDVARAAVLLNDPGGCSRLGAAARTEGTAPPSPAQRQRVNQHLRRCRQCRERHAAIPPPAETFAAAGRAAAPEGLRTEIASDIEANWAGASVAEGSPAPVPADRHEAPAADPAASWLARLRPVAVAASLAAIVAALLLVPGSPVAIISGDDGSPIQPAVRGGGELSGSATRYETATPPPPSTATRAAPAVTGSALPTATVELRASEAPRDEDAPGASGGESHSGSAPLDPTPVPGDDSDPATGATPTMTFALETATIPPTEPAPTATPTPLATSTPTQPPAPTATPTPCHPEIISNIRRAHAGTSSEVSFVIYNNSPCEAAVNLGTAGADGWFGVAPQSATIPAFGQLTVTASIDRASLEPGTNQAHAVARAEPGGAVVDVGIIAEGPAPTP